MWSIQAVFVCALTMLGRSEANFPPVEFIQSVPFGVSRSVEAYVLSDERRIVLVTSTWAFDEAQRAQYRCSAIDAVRHIAGVLAHEEWHLRHGGDEEGAYDAQLTTLRSLGASDTLYNNVKRSKQRVVSEAARLRARGTIARQSAPDVGSMTHTPAAPAGNGP